MRIVHVAAELAPIAKVGGMGDVLLGLSRGLAEQNESVQLILPKYGCLDLSDVQDLSVLNPNLSYSYKNQEQTGKVWRGVYGNIELHLIETQGPFGFADQSSIYGGAHELNRFLSFCLAAAAHIKSLKPEILHLHDWHTAALTALRPPEIPTLLTIHNLAYQGVCKKGILPSFGIDSPLFTDPKDPTHDNLLKGGIELADKVTTVSPTYAKEILRQKPLEKTLQKHQAKLSGILNGIDYTYWNPETDPHLPHRFSLSNLKSKTPYLLAKEQLKEHIQKTLGLDRSCPLVSTICRLVEQKGPKLIIEALLHTVKRGGQFVLVGSAPDSKTEQVFLELQQTFKDNKQVHIELTYNEPLSHLIYAASDLFIVPSIFEPCGLTQMIAMRYGTVPLVRQTGGLADTVTKQNGFSFGPPTSQALTHTLDEAFRAFNTPLWHQLIKNGMTQDFSWNSPTQSYISLYQQLIN